MRITFHGAARNVTGSMFLLEAGGKRLLVDCGLHQGRREESEARNREMPFDPASLDAAVLTHAHLDHSGRLPVLAKKGFRGKVYMTPATRDLLGIMLRDSAHIQESDIKFVNKRHRQKGLPPKEPLYDKDDVEACLGLFAEVDYGKPFGPLPGVTAVFRDAGHILGSAMVEMDASDNGAKKRLLFSGDLGRQGMPIIRDPHQPAEADVLIMESTYGDRLHGALEETSGKLEALVRQTYQRRGKVIIPAFSVGRTQEIVYELHILFKDGRLPPLPIYVDSPLSANATEIFRNHPECFDRETFEQFGREDDPFGFRRLTYVGGPDESKKLNDRDGPCVIISASGMCEGGRVLHHLAHSIGDPKNLVLIVGFQAQGTLGRRLVEKAERVRILGDEYQVRAQVKTLNGFSAHADRDGLLGFVRGIQKGPERIFLVHGEEPQSLALAGQLKKEGRAVEVPVEGQTAEI
jgi:metallo-beta-lactamase family protein